MHDFSIKYRRATNLLARRLRNKTEQNIGFHWDSVWRLDHLYDAHINVGAHIIQTTLPIRLRIRFGTSRIA